MSSIPAWPEAEGPRLLTLVANDITIDIRARKTASSLARTGYSVIALGIDQKGECDRWETLDGALIWRVTPSLDPRISPRTLRLSRAELRDSLRYRVDMRRQRLHLRRRSLTAARQMRSRNDVSWVEKSASFGAAVARWLGGSQQTQDRAHSGIRRRLLRINRAVLFGPSRALLKLEQRLSQVINLIYKAVAKPSHRSPRRGDWRRDLPELHRYEAILGPMVDALGPDLIHVHDVFHMGVAARAKARAQHDGRDIKVVYDAHEYVPGLPIATRPRTAYENLEEEYIHEVDAVVTVSDHMAAAIFSRHGVKAQVVMNAPDAETLIEVEPLRSVCGIPASVDLVTYVGGIAPHRGAELMIEALRSLDDVHLALVVGPVTSYIQGLLDTAFGLGLGGRVHTAPFVVPEGVVSYMRSADASLIPLSRDVANYEVTLPNKLFQSIHAEVPVVVSDNPAMAEFVQQHGIGEVFEGGDSQSMASAIRKVLENRELYREAMRNPDLILRSSWSAQVETLLAVYGQIAGSGHG